MGNCIQVKFIISGRVQGVGFRYYVYEKAKSLLLDGYARNLWDGTVEVVAEGPKDNVLQLKEYLSEGPRMSRVDAINEFSTDCTGEFSGFSIK